MLFNCGLLTIHGVMINSLNKKEYNEFIQTFEDVPKDGRSGYDRRCESYSAFLVGDCATDVFIETMQRTDQFKFFRIGSGGENRIILALTDKFHPVIRVCSRMGNDVPTTYCNKMLFDNNQKEVTFYIDKREVGKCTWEEFSNVGISVLD